MGSLKKLILSLTILSMILLGCQQESEVNHPKNPYTSEEAIENGDVVNLHGEVSNLDRFESFIENVESGAEDEIRITKYTIEGDPIFYHLHFDGNKIQYTYDNSQDEYAGSGKGVISTSCSSLVSNKAENGTEYTLSGCSSEVGNTFYFFIPDDSEEEGLDQGGS